MTIYHTVYKVKNNLNDRFYIGVHSTKDPHDSYLGSGLAIKEAVSKYGKENFTKEILFIFDSPESAYKKESELVDASFISSPLNYNIREGGVYYKHNHETRKKMSDAKCGRKYSQHHKNRISETHNNDNVRRIVTCPVCSKSGQEVAMRRWHFSNCKH